jgi:undecaprenyl pyrophosphate synthase
MLDTQWLYYVGIFSVIGFLLVRRDNQQQAAIDALFKLHHDDVKQLAAFTLDVAKNYHPKAEVSALLDSFKTYLDERFSRLETAVASGGNCPFKEKEGCTKCEK